MQRPQYQSGRPAPSPAALLSRPPCSTQEGTSRMNPWTDTSQRRGVTLSRSHTTCPADRGRSLGPPRPKVPAVQPQSSQGGSGSSRVHPCPEGCSPSCPGGLGELRLTLAQRPWGGSGWPSTLAGVCSPAEKPAGRDGNGAAWRRLLHICVCLCTRGTFRLLLLFKYFNASHLVSYFLKMDTSMSYTHISKCLCIGINTRSRKAQSDS